MSQYSREIAFPEQICRFVSLAFLGILKKKPCSYRVNKQNKRNGPTLFFFSRADCCIQKMAQTKIHFPKETGDIFPMCPFNSQCICYLELSISLFHKQFN